MERKDQLHFNGKDMPWTRLNNRDTEMFVGCKGQDNIVNNFMGRSQKVLNRVPNEALGKEVALRRPMWQRGQHFNSPEIR